MIPLNTALVVEKFRSDMSMRITIREFDPYLYQMAPPYNNTDEDVCSYICQVIMLSYWECV